jgi:hypothetical protein
MFTRAFILGLNCSTSLYRPLFDGVLRLIFSGLNEHAGHRLAASAVVVDETTDGTFDFPCSNRHRSGSGF